MFLHMFPSDYSCAASNVAPYGLLWAFREMEGKVIAPKKKKEYELFHKQGSVNLRRKIAMSDSSQSFLVVSCLLYL